MEKKHYQTSGRARLLDYLKSVAADPPKSADTLYLELDRACSADGSATPGRSSVYRMLATLCEEGDVKKFPAGDGDSSAVYQYVGTHRHCDSHFHLHCLSCGGITHLECSCSNEVADHLFASHGFNVNRGRSILYGTCAACAKKEDR